MITARGALPTLGIAVAALLSWLLYQEVTADRTASDGRHRHDPDAFIDDFDLSSLDDQGRLQHRLWAQRMLHFPDDDSTELTKPYMELYRADQPPWKVSANTGLVSSGGTQVDLQGNVEIHRAGAPGLRPVNLYTSALRAFPDRNYAESDVAVTYRSAGLEVKSVGMRAHLDQGQVELLSKVRATHQPKGKP